MLSLPLIKICPWCQADMKWDPNSGLDQTCPNCRLIVNRNGRHTAESFASVLDILELMPYRETLSAIVPSRNAFEVAAQLGVEELEMRALLVHADVLGRQGEIAESGRIIREVNEWAIEQQHAHILARSHRLLAGFYRRIGQTAIALEQAMRALEKTSESVLSETKVDHLMTLALTLDESGAHHEAIRRFQEVLDICNAMNDVELLMLTLNNMTYTFYELGDTLTASKLVSQLRELSAVHDKPLGAYILDTIARVEMLQGRPADAEKTMQPILTGVLLVDLSELPENLITVVEAQRLQGAIDRAQMTLDKARLLCENQGLAGLLVRVRGEQAQLYAASGRYRDAYEEYRRFHSESETLHSNEREFRARILQAVFDAEEARRDREHFRELSLRDPLTGLHNRRFIDAQIDTLLEESVSPGTPVTVLLLDLDHFKKINDTLSHEVGDTVLVKFAKILITPFFTKSYAARYGGEEFVVILPELGAKEGFQYAEQLRLAIRMTDWMPITGSLPVTASIGVSTAFAGNTSRAALLAQADRNLYVAKRTGRDRVIGDALEVVST